MGRIQQAVTRNPVVAAAVIACGVGLGMVIPGYITRSGVVFNYRRVSEQSTTTIDISISGGDSTTQQSNLSNGNHAPNIIEEFTSPTIFNDCMLYIEEDHLTILAAVLTLVCGFTFFIVKFRPIITNYKLNKIFKVLRLFIYGPAAPTFEKVFRDWVVNLKDTAKVCELWGRSNWLIGGPIVGLLSFFFEYCFISVFVLNNIVFAELLPAYYANIISFAEVLDTSYFSTIEDKIEQNARLVKGYIELSKIQYSPEFSLAEASCFAYNLYELLHQVVAQLSVFSFIVLQWKFLMFPGLAPVLDLLDLFDNSPKSEYLGLGYSEFAIRGAINTIIIVKAKGLITDLPISEVNLAICFLNKLINSS